MDPTQILLPTLKCFSLLFSALENMVATNKNPTIIEMSRKPPSSSSSTLRGAPVSTRTTKARGIVGAAAAAGEPGDTLPEPNIPAMTPDEKKDFREALLKEINAKINHFNYMRWLWEVLFYVLSVLAAVGGLASVVFSTTSLTQVIPLSPQTISLILTVTSIVSTVALSLNGQLQARMKAVYFAEAVSSPSGGHCIITTFSTTRATATQWLISPQCITIFTTTYHDRPRNIKCLPG